MDQRELSVVIPCLNENETIGHAVTTCLNVFKQLNINGEVIVVDNGSDDGSGELAKVAGAKVFVEPRKGYGNALLRGIRESIGRYIFMADADMSYDFTDIGKFLDHIGTCDMLIGCRFSRGGGNLEKGAMPILNQIGNFFLSNFTRILFGIKIHDFHCGARMFVREKIISLDLNSEGMEFASELIIAAHKKGLCIGEIGIHFKKDKRINNVIKLRPFRDGFRHIKYILKAFFVLK